MCPRLSLLSQHIVSSCLVWHLSRIFHILIRYYFNTCTHMCYAGFARATRCPFSFCQSLQTKCLSHRCRKIEGLLKHVIQSGRQLAVTLLSKALFRHKVINTSLSRTVCRALVDKMKCSRAGAARDSDPIRSWAVTRAPAGPLVWQFAPLLVGAQGRQGNGEHGELQVRYLQVRLHEISVQRPNSLILLLQRFCHWLYV